jgi:hypothetical protein
MVWSFELSVLIMASLTLGIIACILIGKHKRSSLVVWILFTILPVIGILVLNKPHWLIILALSSSTGIFLQSLMASSIGKVFVEKSDQAMQRLGIS